MYARVPDRLRDLRWRRHRLQHGHYHGVELRRLRCHVQRVDPDLRCGWEHVRVLQLLRSPDALRDKLRGHADQRYALQYVWQ